MNGWLFKSLLRTHAQTMISYGVGVVFYLWVIIWVFPSIAASAGLDQVLQSMPASLLAAFGIQGGIHHLGDFMASEFYGLIYLLIMAVYAISTATKLVARLVDKGSMAYLLATPVSRVKVTMTNGVTLLFGLLVISLFSTVGGIAGSHWFIAHPDLNTGTFLQMNLVGFLLFAVIAAYSFFFSCIFNDEKRALGASALLTLVFYALDMVGKLSSQVGWMKHLSVFETFQPQSILHGDVHVLPIALGLAASVVIIFGLSVYVFRRRELPL